MNNRHVRTAQQELDSLHEVCGRAGAALNDLEQKVTVERQRLAKEHGVSVDRVQLLMDNEHLRLVPVIRKEG